MLHSVEIGVQPMQCQWIGEGGFPGYWERGYVQVINEQERGR